MSHTVDIFLLYEQKPFMITFILQIIAVLALGFIVYMLGRVVPRVHESDIEKAKETSMFHWLVGYLEQVDDWLLWLFEKFLRKLRVNIMKLDNVVSKRLAKFKKEQSREVGLSFEKKESVQEEEK